MCPLDFPKAIFICTLVVVTSANYKKQKDAVNLAAAKNGDSEVGIMHWTTETCNRVRGDFRGGSWNGYQRNHLTGFLHQSNLHGSSSICRYSSLKIRSFSSQHMPKGALVGCSINFMFVLKVGFCLFVHLSLMIFRNVHVYFVSKKLCTQIEI